VWGQGKSWLHRLQWSALVLCLGIALAACSPEAARTRGGGRGADIGNKAPEVQLHPTGPGSIYYLTPREGEGSQLAGMPIE